jgi:hypothetical protein
MQLIQRDLTGPRRRRRNAGALDRLIEDAHSRPSAIRQRNPVVERAVVLACVEPFQEIREILADVDDVPVSESAVRRLETFLCDGSRSALYAHDPSEAHRAARELATTFRWSAARTPGRAA